MNLLQAEFKSVKVQTPEEKTNYIVTDFSHYSVAYYCFGFWGPDNVKSINGHDDIELDFEPTHFAEIKTGEEK